MQINQLIATIYNRFRQYGLWDRYTDDYPDQDLVYTVGVSNYQIDWFFAHVNRFLLHAKVYIGNHINLLF